MKMNENELFWFVNRFKRKLTWKFMRLALVSPWMSIRDQKPTENRMVWLSWVDHSGYSSFDGSNTKQFRIKMAQIRRWELETSASSGSKPLFGYFWLGTFKPEISCNFEKVRQRQEKPLTKIQFSFEVHYFPYSNLSSAITIINPLSLMYNKSYEYSNIVMNSLVMFTPSRLSAIGNNIVS